MGLNKQIQKELDRFGRQFTEDLQKSLASKGSRYEQSNLFGKIGQAVTPATFKDGSFTLRIVLPSYYYWVDKGREPGNVNEEGQESIGEWANRTKSRKGSGTVLGGFIKQTAENSLKQRKLKQDEAKSKNKKRKNWKTLKEIRPSFTKAKKQFAFLVARKLQADGYKSDAEGFFTEVYEDGRLKFLSDELSRITGKEIVIELTRNI